MAGEACPECGRITGAPIAVHLEYLCRGRPGEPAPKSEATESPESAEQIEAEV